MQKLLIKLSRHRSVMVPVVTLLAIGIGISGYYIQNRQIVAREEQEKQQQQTAAQTNNTTDNVAITERETVEESTKITEDGQAAEVVGIELSVENRPENSEVVITAKIDSSKPGVCAIYLKQGNYGPEESVTVKDKQCEARLQNPGSGAWEAKVLYTSTDGMTRGDAKQTINL